MPLYEFECQKCQKISEFLLKISDPHPDVCPVCEQQAQMKKLLSRTSFVLKGTGWYETDFKQKAKASTDSPAAAKPSDGAEAAATSPASADAPAAAPKEKSSEGGDKTAAAPAAATAPAPAPSSSSSV